MESGIRSNRCVAGIKTKGGIDVCFSVSVTSDVGCLSRGVAGGLATDGADATDGGGAELSTNQIVCFSVSDSVTTRGGLSASDVGEVAQAGESGIGGNVDAASVKASAVIEVGLSF